MSAEIPSESEQEKSSYKKRKRHVLNIKEKCDILEKLKQGQSVVSISNEYKVCRSTIWGIKQSESKILSFSAQIGAASSSRKTMKTSEDYNLDSSIYKWFLEQAGKGVIMSNQMICDEALKLNKQFNGELMDFKATRGWLRRFKARHGITNQYLSKNILVDDNEDSFNATASAPVSEKSEENELNGYRNEWETRKTDPENSQRSTDAIVPEVSIKEEEPTEIIDDDDNQQMTEENIPRKPTDEEAFNAIDTVIQWAEMQREVNVNHLMFLRTLQSTAAKRALASISRK